MFKFINQNTYLNLQSNIKDITAIKAIILFLTLSYSQVYSSDFTNKVSIQVKDANIEEVFNEIHDQTGLDFLYNSALLKNLAPVNLNYNNTDLAIVLAACLEPNNLSFTIDKKTVLILKNEKVKQITNLQQEYISGKVSDEDGRPIQGVTVRFTNQTSGTSTDENGEYQLKLDKSGKGIQFTAVSYEPKEVALSLDSSIINVVLKDKFRDLEEVVVVGYGTQKRENLTGAIDQISGDDIAMGPSSDITSSLQGVMPGLNIQVNSGDPANKPDINIRGFNSINGGSPLVLVDGIEGDISRVNPLDIESVTVLKDASSAAIYGARGAFGVILVTTKSGESGDMKVNYSNSFNFTTPTTRTDFITDPYVYGKTVDAALFGYNGGTYTRYNDDDWDKIKRVANGELEPFHELQADGTNKFFYNTDWHSYLFKKWQPSNYHNISVSGGSDKLKAYLSGRVFERETIQNITDANVERYNLKANITFQANDWLELSNNIKFTREIDEEYGGYRNGYGGIWSTTTWYDLFPFLPNKIDGIPTDVGRDGSGGQGGGAALEDGNNWRKYNTEEFVNTFRVKATPMKGLEFNLDYSNSINNTDRTYRYNEFEYLTSNRLEMQTVGINRLGEWRWKDRYNALNIFGSYTFNLASKHNFKAMLGYNRENFDSDRVAAQSDGLLIRDLANLGLGTEMLSIEGSATVWALEGYFGRFNYNYDGKYLLEVNSRYDGSSRFPDGSRWGFFPSVSAGWQINRESFWEPIADKINTMKLRASYGKLGNQNIGVNTFQQLMSVGRSSWLDGGSRLNYAKSPNPLPRVVTWEKTKTIDVGVDLSFLNNSLHASFDVYQKDIEGMYLPGEPLPAVFGASEPRENYASLRNKGYELSVSYNNKVMVGGSPLAFSVSGSVSNFKGIITKYDNPQGLMSTYWEGQELGQIWGYHVDGQFQSDEAAATYQNSFDNPSKDLGKVYKYILNGVQNSEWSKLRAGDLKYVDVNGDGKIDQGAYTLDDHGDLQPIGNAMPKFPFGFNIRANWKEFDVAVAGAGVGKQNWYPTGDIYWGTYQRPYLSFIRKDLISNAWTPESPNNTYPQIERGYASLGSERSLYEMNDYYLRNIGFLRIKNITLGYTLPTTLTKKVKIEKLRVFFSGENLLTWRFGDLSNYIDPEQAGSGINYSKPGDAVGRADLRDYPMGKTYSIGVNITL